MRYSFSPATSLTIPSESSCSSEKLPPGSDRTMSLKMRAGITTRPSPSTSAHDDVWIEISMSVADSPSSSPLPSRSIPPSNWMVDLAETPRETSASFLPNVSVLQTALILPPFSPYYYYLNHISIRTIIIIRPVDMCITRKNRLTYAEKSSSGLWTKMWITRDSLWTDCG